MSTETNSSGASRRSTGFSLSDTHEEFIGQRNRLPSGLKAFLTPHTPEDYIKLEADLYLSNTKLSGLGSNPMEN